MDRVLVQGMKACDMADILKNIDANYAIFLNLQWGFESKGALKYLKNFKNIPPGE